MVVRDALRPEHDVVRRGGFDDPTGGVLDGAPDAPWMRRLRPVRQARVLRQAQGVASMGAERGPSVIARYVRPFDRLRTSPSTGSGSVGPANPGRTVVQAWLASRGLILLVALLISLREGRDFARVVAQWDVEHFTLLAHGGYLGREDGTLMAFFPGLPMLLRAGTWLGLPVEITGVLLAAARLRRGGGRAAPARRTVGGGGLAVRSHRGVHDRALHRGVVLRGGVLGLGAGPRRPLARGGPARGGGLQHPGVGALPGRRPVRDDSSPTPRSRRIGDGASGSAEGPGCCCRWP